MVDGAHLHHPRTRVDPALNVLTVDDGDGVSRLLAILSGREHSRPDDLLLFRQLARLKHIHLVICCIGACDLAFNLDLSILLVLNWNVILCYKV